MFLFTYACPQYQSDDDDIISFVSSMTICLLTLCAMVLSYSGVVSRNDGSGSQRGFNANFIGGTMIVITVANLLFNILMLFKTTGVAKRCRRRSCARCGGGNTTMGGEEMPVAQTSRLKVSQTKVTPEAASSSSAAAAASEFWDGCEERGVACKT